MKRILALATLLTALLCSDLWSRQRSGAPTGSSARYSTRASRHLSGTATATESPTSPESSRDSAIWIRWASMCCWLNRVFSPAGHTSSLRRARARLSSLRSEAYGRG